MVRRAKKKTVTKKQEKKQNDLFAMVATFFAMWIMIASPLWLEDQYFNQTTAKGHAFLAGAVITLFLLLCTILAKRDLRPLKPSGDVTEWAIVAFGALALISSLLSEYIVESLFGWGGWWVGGFQMALFSLFAIFFSNKLQWSTLLEGTIMSVGIIVYFIALLHGIGIDVLSLHENMVEGQYWSYLSTIGNINWFVGFMALTVPVILICFLKNSRSEWNIFYCIYLFMACIGIVFCRSDGLYIGFGVCAFFAVPFILSKAQYFRRFLLMIAFYGVVMTGTLFIPACSHMISIGSLAGMFARPAIAISMAAAGLAGYFIIKIFNIEFSPGAAKAATIIVEVILAAIVVYFIIDTIKTFDDSWGSRRGLIWSYTITHIFSDMPLFNKIIGYGPETLFVYNESLSQAFGMNVRANHSDILQFLITNGILGVAAWLTMWIGIIIRHIRFGNIESDSFMFFVAIMAYFGQSLVNTTECLSWPILIVILGLYLHYSKRDLPEKSLA